MSLLDDFTAVDFSELTPSGIEGMVITAYEEASGQTVYPGDPVRLFLQSNAYIISLLAAFINETGNQQYLAHARGPHQDLIGALVDTARLRGRLFALRTDINGLLHTAGRLVYDAHRGSTGGEDALEQVFSELDHKEAAAAELRSRLERLRQEKPL